MDDLMSYLALLDKAEAGCVLGLYKELVLQEPTRLEEPRELDRLWKVLNDLRYLHSQLLNRYNQTLSPNPGEKYIHQCPEKDIPSVMRITLTYCEGENRRPPDGVTLDTTDANGVAVASGMSEPFGIMSKDKLKNERCSGKLSPTCNGESGQSGEGFSPDVEEEEGRGADWESDSGKISAGTVNSRDIVAPVKVDVEVAEKNRKDRSPSSPEMTKGRHHVDEAASELGTEDAKTLAGSTSGLNGTGKRYEQTRQGQGVAANFFRAERSGLLAPWIDDIWQRTVD
ncbi:hypothetical protein HDU96_004509 [Phlyctochytrium bullatum]|nr:hypothetical protein HDU96_004509 [Phlyctochytrium bullatum]